MREIILASSSPFRKVLFAKLQLPFRICSPDVDETPKAEETTYDQVERLSFEKALKVSQDYPDALVIGSDSLAEVEGQAVGKPYTYENAVKQLQTASGKTMRFYTGLCLFDGLTQEKQMAVEIWEIKCRHLTLSMIENYLNKEQPYQSCGGIKAETVGIALFESMKGNDFNALLGLPLIRLVDMFKKVGVEVL
jgi:MAF protein